MAFFGYDNPIDLENEKHRFLDGDGQRPNEKIAVYTWGAQGYDGLGDELQEGGDELNDVTFGEVDDVGESVLFSAVLRRTRRLDGTRSGRDFDFSHSVLPSDASSQATTSRGPQVRTPVREQSSSQSTHSSCMMLPTSPVSLLLCSPCSSSGTFVGIRLGRQVSFFCPRAYEWVHPNCGAATSVSHAIAVPDLQVLSFWCDDS